jgi:hypothetical protein
MAMSWALPTPHTILIIELDWELFHPVNHCRTQRLLFQGLESKHTFSSQLAYSSFK